MSMNSGNVFLCCMFLCFSSFSFSQTGEWKLSKDQNGIKIYSRQVEGYSIEELKTEMNVKAPMNAVVAVIMDANNYYSWIYSCTSSAILKKISETEQYQYQVNDLPYPFNDRDIAIHFKIWQDKETKKVFTSSVGEPAYVPAKDGLVRIPVFIGGYEITPLANGEVQLAYQVRFDPGGNIPDWLVNMFIVKAPYESSLNLRELIESKKYDGTKFGFLTQ